MAVAAIPRRWQSGEPRALGRAVRLLQRLQEQCGDPRLASSPPSLRNLLPRTAKLLREVAHARQAGGGGGHEGPGGARDFLIVYLANLEAKSRQVATLLPPRGQKSTNDELFREGSIHRRQLAKLALIFSHMCAELSALFPEGKYCGHTYRVTTTAAHSFWREHCGARCVLPWAEFESLLCTCHPMESGPTTFALRSTIDLTFSGHVSIFEFDIFTRLFQPWPTLLKNWQFLAVNHPGYMAFLTYDEVQARLQACRDKPGSYIFRPSCTRLGQWAIGYVTSDGSIVQTIPQNQPLFQALLEGQKEGFYLYPDGKNHNPDLTELFHMEPQQHIQVSEEQLQLYWDMDSTFELCKICAEGNKDVKIKPCGHLLCSRCLDTWQRSDSQTCPFCRSEIQGQEVVSVHQFPGRPAEARAAAEDPGKINDWASEEEEMGQVTPSAPPLPPHLDLPPGPPRSKGQLTVTGCCVIWHPHLRLQPCPNSGPLFFCQKLGLCPWSHGRPPPARRPGREPQRHHVALLREPQGLEGVCEAEINCRAFWVWRKNAATTRGQLGTRNLGALSPEPHLDSPGILKPEGQEWGDPAPLDPGVQAPSLSSSDPGVQSPKFSENRTANLLSPL